jgi:hypothetical protein
MTINLRNDSYYITEMLTSVGISSLNKCYPAKTVMSIIKLPFTFHKDYLKWLQLLQINVHVHLLVSDFLVPFGRYPVALLEHYRLLPYHA